MTSSSRLAALALAASLATGTLSTTAFAQQPSATDLETARELNKEGKELRGRGDLQGALAKFKIAHELGRTPITGIELARTQVMLSQLVEAREVCLGIARMPVAPDETDRSAAARQEAAKLAEDLRPRIPSVTVQLDGVPTGRAPVVMIDRAVVPNETLREARRVNPGKHEIMAKLPRGAEATALVDLAEGESRLVRLAVPPEPPGSDVVTITPGPAQGQGAQGSGSAGFRPHKRGANGLAIAGFVVAGAGALVGAVTGLVVLGEASNLESKCGPEKHCPLDAHNDLSAAKTLATVSTVSFVVAGAGLVMGIVGVASRSSGSDADTARVERRPFVRPYLAPSGAGVTGAF